MFIDIEILKKYYFFNFFPRMDIVKIGITLLLLILSVDLPGILGRKIDRNMYKISEESSLSRIPVDFQPCGDQIMWAFEMICMPLWGRKWSKHRHRRRHKRGTYDIYLYSIVNVTDEE